MCILSIIGSVSLGITMTRAPKLLPNYQN
jgi:hypothetical protein